MGRLDFVALDLETATRQRTSICEIGIAAVHDGVVQKPQSWLVRPPQNHYEGHNIAVHGIHPEQTAHEPPFEVAWRAVAPQLDRRMVVAHNTRFDMYCLEQSFRWFRLPFPTLYYIDTLRLSRQAYPELRSHRLDDLCRDLGIDPGHHHRAGDDAAACAMLMLKLIEHFQVSSFGELARQRGFTIGGFDGCSHRPQRKE